MGKRKTVISAIENQENLAPEFHTQHTEEKMQTRSTKAPSSTESSPQKEYPAISLINSLTEQSKLQSPTQTAEQIVTPSKDESTAIVTIQSEDTPTTNLKILCEVADDQEVVEGAHIILSQGESSDGNIEVQPVTPTSNLKMLITAASPEIRTLEMTKTRLFTEGEAMIVTEPGEDHDYYDDEVMSSQEAGGSGKKSCRRSSGAARKERSLGLLCQRFMNEFDPHPPQTARIEVCLDELASHLGTERRRIYDIVNVLESVEIMSRRAKNRYLWHGRTLLNATLVKLKHFAESEKIGQQMELLKEMEVSRMYGKKSELDTEDIKRHPKFEEYMKTFGHAYKKDRSLGVMSQKFLMIFLVSSSKTINLDLAAKVLLGDPLALEGSRSNSQFKTKIRRLYDIANIFASLDLICKVHVTEVRGRKPAFSYIGPDVDHLASLDEYQYLKNVEVTRPGRTTLEMKMDELKRKMEETISNDKLTGVSSQSKTVPPVAIEPDLSKVKLRLPDINSSPAPGSQKATSLLNKPSVLILPSITSSQSPSVTSSNTSTHLSSTQYYLDQNGFLVASSYPSQIASNTADSTNNLSSITLMPFNTDSSGSQIVYKTNPALASPNNPPRKILPAKEQEGQSLLNITQVKPAKRSIAELIIETSGETSSKKPRVLETQVETTRPVGEETTPVNAERLVTIDTQGLTTTSSQTVEHAQYALVTTADGSLQLTPISSDQSQIVYLPVSGTGAAQQITFLTSPETTPVRVTQSQQNISPQSQSIREITLK